MLRLCLLILLAPALASAQPAIASVSGTLGHGQTITVNSTGTNFGAGAAPHCWADFETSAMDSAAHLNAECDWQDQLQQFDPTVCDDRLRANSAQTRNVCSHWDDTDATTQGASNIHILAAMRRVWLDWWYYIDSSNASNFGSGSNAPNVKIFRLHGDFAGDGVPNAYVSAGHPPTSSVLDATCAAHDGAVSGEIGACAPSTGSENGNIPNNEYVMTSFYNNWRHYQICAEISTTTNANGTWILYIDGALRYNRPGNINLTESGYTGDWEALFFGNYVRSDTSNFDGDFYAYSQAILVGNGCGRVEIGNHATYASATHREPCPIITWSTSVVTCEFNRGSILVGASIYVYLCNDANQCDSDGPYTVGADAGGGGGSGGGHSFGLRIRGLVSVVSVAPFLAVVLLVGVRKLSGV